jgi:hypothetical protein
MKQKCNRLYIKLQRVGYIISGYKFKVDKDSSLTVILNQIIFFRYKQNPGW